MEIGMRKQRIAIMCIAAMALFMTACGSTIPEMTEEQTAQVAEYAAGLLLKYDENYHSRLVEEPEAAIEEEPLEEEEVKEEELPAEAAEEEPEEETVVVDKSEEVQAPIYSSIEEFYGIEGVAITYNGYEIKDMYPEQSSSDEMFFAMNATAGCKLLVLNFNVTNTSGQDKNLDMLSMDTKFKVSVNGETPRYALTTMLTNDLASYVGTIMSDATEPMVLVCEIPEDKAGDIQSLSLEMRNMSESTTISLD